MPNWIYNTVTIDGAAKDVKEIHETNFDFEKLHPCPHPCDEQPGSSPPWYVWRCAHWGTKWPAGEIEIISYEEGEQNSVLEVTFDTAWSPPHTLLAYLTKLWPSLKIRNNFVEEGDQTVGEASYERGSIAVTQFHPYDYKPSALEKFAEKVDWFDWESYKDNRDEEDLESQEEDGQSHVRLTSLVMTYEEFVEDSQKEFAAIDEAIKKGDVVTQRGS